MCMLLWLLVSSSFKRGNIGEQEFKILEEGFLENTEAKNTLTTWEKIKSVWIDDLFILVKSKRGFHIIPKKSFSKNEQFNQFYEAILNHWNKHKSHNKSVELT